ncbi:MAG TPA: hypothetical protein VMZ74_02065 [Ramlibacter sp.]|nr:hypothetical protein [Ramlibacter sp.]
MKREFAAIVLSILAQAATAQCLAPSASQANAQGLPITETVHAAGTTAPPAQPAHVRAELIKSAAAGTRDDAPPVMTARQRVNGQQDHPRRGGTAMLLAALALMSGIALRRYGAPRA